MTYYIFINSIVWSTWAYIVVISCIGIALVDWSEPIFHDNSVTPLQIIRTPDRMNIPSMNGKNNAIMAEDQGIGMGLFPIGTSTIVKYTATDASGNNATCSLDITVE